MTTSTPRADSPVPPPPAAAPRLPRPARRRGLAAFTLTEVLVSATLTGFILTGVLSTFLLLGRTGFNTSAYVAMNSSLRAAVERFDHDVRLAADVRWRDERGLTLVMPAGAGPDITYAFEPAADPAAPGRLTRRSAADAAPKTLSSDIAPDFAFRRYRLDSASGAAVSARNDLETKLLEIRLRAVRPGAQAPSASQLALSARCVLRNKNSG